MKELFKKKLYSSFFQSKTSELVTPKIENEIKFMAVNSTILSMEHISIFLAKDRKERVPISQGSGFYELQLSDPGIITVEYDSKKKELIITPLQVGNVSKFEYYVDFFLTLTFSMIEGLCGINGSLFNDRPCSLICFGSFNGSNTCRSI